MIDKTALHRNELTREIEGMITYDDFQPKRNSTIETIDSELEKKKTFSKRGSMET